MVANHEINGNITAWKGITMAAIKNMKIMLESLVFVRTKTHAAIEEINIRMATDTTVIIKDETNDDQ
jgi:hypothetical protein